MIGVRGVGERSGGRESERDKAKTFFFFFSLSLSPSFASLPLLSHFQLVFSLKKTGGAKVRERLVFNELCARACARFPSSSSRTQALLLGATLLRAATKERGRVRERSKSSSTSGVAGGRRCASGPRRARPFSSPAALRFAFLLRCVICRGRIAASQAENEAAAALSTCESTWHQSSSRAAAARKKKTPIADVEKSSGYSLPPPSSPSVARRCRRSRPMIDGVLMCRCHGRAKHAKEAR